MENNYLAEAFKKLSLLEDEFNFSADKDAIDELSYFVSDDIDEIPEETIIDPEAHEEDELQDHYIGKVVMECQCCHSRMYKDPAEVVIDDDSGLANIEEECPICGNTCGYTVIGEIKPFDGAPEVKDDIEPEEEPEEEEDIKLSESVKSALKKINEDIDKVTVKTDDGEVKVDHNDGRVTVDFSNEDDIPVEENAESIVPLDDDTMTQIENNVPEDDEMSTDDIPLENEEIGVEPLDNEPVEEEPATEEPIEEEPLEEPTEEESEEEEEEEEEVAESLNESNLADKLKAKLNRLSNTEDSLDEDVNLEEANLADKLKAKLARLANEEPLEEGVEELTEDSSLRDKLMKKLQSLEMKNEDLTMDDIEDIDDEAYDDLMESYLNRVYSNVDSFKTKKVDIDNGTLVVEGLIKFKSGNQRNTTFNFDKISRSKKGDIVLEGTNKTFTNMSKAYKLRSSMKNGKLLPESMIYHYVNRKLNESDGSKSRIYGRVKISK